MKTGSRPRSQLEVEAFVHSNNGDGRKKLQRSEIYQKLRDTVSEDRLNDMDVLICTQTGRGLEHSKVTEVFARISRHLDSS